MVVLLSNAALWPLLAVITVAGISFPTAVSPGFQFGYFLLNHRGHIRIGLMLAQVDLRAAAVHQLIMASEYREKMPTFATGK